MNTLLIIFAISGIMACERPASYAAEAAMEAPTSVDLTNEWDQLLKAHVRDGLVDYKGFLKDKDKLDAYCALLSNNPPAEDAAKDAKLAYFINLYNAQTVKLIVDNYPVKSIQDLHPTIKIPLVNTVWHKTRFMVGKEEMSLDEVEHAVLRKMDEPRIHFAINCASISCPPLRNEAYTSEKLDRQLTDQARVFINDPRYNKITPTHVELSKIFSWFEGDFKNNGTLIQFVNRYSKVQIKANAKVDHIDYDWSLNEIK